jgi:hypothetical protein
MDTSYHTLLKRTSLLAEVGEEIAQFLQDECRSRYASRCEQGDYCEWEALVVRARVEHVMTGTPPGKNLTKSVLIYGKGGDQCSFIPGQSRSMLKKLVLFHWEYEALVAAWDLELGTGVGD